MSREQNRQDPIVMVIDFHHARGPEIELCIGDEGTDATTENDWSLLPFMALSDGAHASIEEFSYFTLRRDNPGTSLFGISCSRQIDANTLLYRPADVTRSTVQKAVVVVTDSPQSVAQLREKLSIVTSAWFAQRNFSDVDILKKFREGLVLSLNSDEGRKDQNLGLSLREMIHEFKYQTLVLFKALLLQPKMLFFGSRCERLCMIQFSLISLIPGIINHLQDSADPSFDSYTENVEKPTSLKTSDRSSLLSYMGLPLQIFGKGSMFGPYTPLQQLDLLADGGTKSYVVGSTNSLLLQQKDRYSDILINLDEDTINILSPSFRGPLALSAADRRWIDFLTQVINETWDDSQPERPKTHGFMGSEEFIRLQFEEYLLALLSCMKYHEDLNSFNTGESGHKSRAQLEAFNIEGDPALEFNAEFLAHWQTTSNYALFKRLTSDALLFSIVEPRHPCAGGLTIEDVQRRISQQVAELHLDDRVRESREALGRHLSTGQKKVSAVFNSFWADIDAMRDAQRKRNEERASQSQSTRSSLDVSSPTLPPSDAPTSASSPTITDTANRKNPTVDIAQAQASVNAVGQRAGAYFSSWGTWASEKRKEWQEKKDKERASSPSSHSSPSTPTLTSISEISEDNPTTATTTNKQNSSNSNSNNSDRGRNHSTPPYSEDQASISSTGPPSRSGSRRKRWSNMLLRRDSGEYSLASPTAEETYPKSPLSREAPVLGEDLARESTSESSITGSDNMPTPVAEVTPVPETEQHTKGTTENAHLNSASSASTESAVEEKASSSEKQNENESLATTPTPTSSASQKAHTATSQTLEGKDISPSS